MHWKCRSLKQILVMCVKNMFRFQEWFYIKDNAFLKVISAFLSGYLASVSGYRLGI